MKITEPKTPYAKQYDPAEDEEELAILNAEELKVDELDARVDKQKKRGEDEIPGLDIGEPEMDPLRQHQETPEGDKRVIVDPVTEDDVGRHGEESADMTQEEREKHKKFEEMRRKHYEMKNVRNLLGYGTLTVFI
jgi:protein phosphatase inhibitor 2